MSDDEEPDRYRVTGRRMRGHLGDVTENLTREQTNASRRSARRTAISWAGEGFTVWLMERREPVPDYTAGRWAWATIDEFSPTRPYGYAETPPLSGHDEDGAR